MGKKSTQTLLYTKHFATIIKASEEMPSDASLVYFPIVTAVLGAGGLGQLVILWIGVSSHCCEFVVNKLHHFSVSENADKVDSLFVT